MPIQETNSTNSIMKLLYPTSLILDTKHLEADISSITCKNVKNTGTGTSISLHPYDVTSPIPASHHDASILVTWCNSAANLQSAATSMRQLRWIQSLAAGPNDVLNAGFGGSGSVTVTTGSGLHDETVAEHTLALLLCAARRLFEMREWQVLRPGTWAKHLGGPQPDRPRDRFTTLKDANVLVWGFGNIGRKLAGMLITMGAHVRGIARTAPPGSVREKNGVEVFAESVEDDDDLFKRLLPDTDALVMILPGSESTRNALNAERLRLLPRHAWVVNVGRGTCVDEEALADALDADQIGGAALDVFVQEPLPETSRLWRAKNCLISPHAAGGRPRGAEELIVDNLTRFLNGDPLRNVI